MASGKSFTKRLRILFSVLLIVNLTIPYSFSAYADPGTQLRLPGRSYNLFVQGVQVKDSNKDDVLGDGTVKFDPETVKLTLDNANIEISRRINGDDGNEYGIRSNLGDGIAEFNDKPLTIELIGTNTISDSNNDEETTNKYGIFVASSGPVTYTGGGTLNVNMKDANTAKRYLGLEHRQSITVDGVDINIDIDGTADINGIYVLYSNTFSLTNGSNVLVDVAKGYAYDNNNQGNKDLSVAEGCVFEAVSGGAHGALHGNNWVQLTDATKELGAAVNTEPTRSGRTEWDGTTDLGTYKYVRIPGIPTVTVNYDLGAGHEALAQANALKTAIEKRHGMKVLGVEGSVVKIKVPELSPNNTKNTVARLLGALQVALNESVGHDPWYGPYWVYDQDQWNFNNALKTIENYSSYDEVNQESEDAEASKVMPTDGQTIYALWANPVNEVALDAESPICGTEVTADPRDPADPEMGLDEKSQKPQPVVSTSTEHVAIYVEDERESTWWVDPTDKDETWFTILPPCFTGTMEGGKDYMLVANVKTDFGYYLPEDVTYTTSNGVIDTKLSTGMDLYGYAFVTVAAEHAWGEWKVTKEPTAEAEGEETRTCTCCDKTETRPIPKLDPEAISYRNTQGDGSSWTKGSTNTLDFIFKRNTNDEKTFDQFQGIQVDGKDVAEDDYTKEAGSVIVKLKPEYLETLSVGTHTLKAIFADGNNPEVTFVITGNKVVPNDKTTPNTKQATPTGKTAHTPDTNPVLPFLGLAMLSLIGLYACRVYRPAAERSSSTRSVRSQVNSGSSRPK